MSRSSEEITQLLVDARKGDRAAIDELLPAVYDELRKTAAGVLRTESRPDHTLQPTALVHEAYIRMLGSATVEWQNRAHFFGFAATVMRNILVDYARARRREKRGGGHVKVSLDEAMHYAGGGDVNLIALDDALTALSRVDPRMSRLVELRFFGGLSVEESAEVLGISRATANREWVLAQAWLRREMARA